MKKLQHIDAILFDMMGVLLFRPSGYQPNLRVDKIDALIGQVVDDNAFRQRALEKFHLNEKEFESLLKKIVAKYEPLPELWKILPALKRHYKLAIINNGTTLTLREFDKKLNFDKYFDLFISSAKEKVKKPSGGIFFTTAKRLEVAPERCLFMDDCEKNIMAAKRVGMHTILWINKKDGFKKFTKLIGV